MAPELTALDFMNLPRYEVYTNFMSDGKATGWIRGTTFPPGPAIRSSVELRARCQSRYGVPAELLTLEILEGAALENAEEFDRTVCELREKGFQVSMDDFGSGYSSLNTLGSLHIDEVKLDRGFLREVSSGANERMRLVMEQIIALCKKLHIRTVVEGVETAEDDRMIRGWGCETGQGYYYGKPVCAEEFTKQYLEK